MFNVAQLLIRMKDSWIPWVLGCLIWPGARIFAGDRHIYSNLAHPNPNHRVTVNNADALVDMFLHDSLDQGGPTATIRQICLNR